MDDKTKNNKKLISVVLLLIIAAVAAFGVWYFNFREENNSSNQQQTLQTEDSSQAIVSEDGKSVSYDGVDNQTALALLKQYVNVETEEFTGIGEYVVSINGVAADSTSNFWGFYVNGEQAQVGAGDYVTKTTDKIEWRLEDVEAFEE